MISESVSRGTTPPPPAPSWDMERRVLEYIRTVDYHRTKTGLIPQTPHPRQRVFLLLADTLEVLYGGAAGGGKSSAALMSAVQYAHVPGYAALLLRKTFPDLMQPNALIPRAKQWWYGREGVTWHEQTRRFTFACPDGGSSSITFGYIDREDDVYQYAGAEYQYIGIDELTQHREWVYRFLFSRIRRPSAGPLSQVPLRMRGFSNPGGRGHEFVKKRFLDPETRDPDALFVSAKLADNPSLDAEEYRRSLGYLDPVTRAQLEAGDWDAVEGGRFKREWFRYYRRDDSSPDFIRSDYWRFKLTGRPVFMTVDPAASAKQTADYTTVGVYCVGANGELLWRALERFQAEIPDIPPVIARMVRRWHPLFVAVEAVASNRAVSQILQRWTDPVIPVREVTPRGLDKLVRATPAMVLAGSGRLYLPEDDRSFPMEDVIGELVRFTGDEKKDDHDDIVDNLSYACELLPQLGYLSSQGAKNAPTHYQSAGPFDGRLMGHPAMGGHRR